MYALSWQAEIVTYAIAVSLPRGMVFLGREWLLTVCSLLCSKWWPHQGLFKHTVQHLYMCKYSSSGHFLHLLDKTTDSFKCNLNLLWSFAFKFLQLNTGSLCILMCCSNNLFSELHCEAQVPLFGSLSVCFHRKAVPAFVMFQFKIWSWEWMPVKPSYSWSYSELGLAKGFKFHPATLCAGF